MPLEMEWGAAIIGLALDDATAALAANPTVVLNSLAHPIKTLCQEFVEFSVSPTDPEKLEAALPALSVPFWAAFYQDDSLDLNDSPFSTSLLSPQGINTAVEELKRLGFDIKAYPSAGALASSMEAFVMAHKDKPNVLAMRPAYLQKVSPGAAATHPKATQA